MGGSLSSVSAGNRDTIRAGEDADTVYGDAKNLSGALTLVGGGLDDTTDGGAGNDSGDAGPGRDTCTNIEPVTNCESL